MHASPKCMWTASLVTLLLVQGCSCDSSDDVGAGTDGAAGDSGLLDGASQDARRRADGSLRDADNTTRTRTLELWVVASSRKLLNISFDRATAEPGAVSVSTLTGADDLFMNMLTQLEDGSLVAAGTMGERPPTFVFHIPNPPRDGSDAEASMLGQVPENVLLEALYTDCDDRLYGMDTGANVSSAEGNRLLRFTGSPLQGDLAFEVVSDLSTASVADIDDMGPGIDSSGKLTDNPGFAIDTSAIHDFNYETGSGTMVGGGGRFGIHVLGGALFGDGVSRLYVSNQSGGVRELDPETFDTIRSISTGLDERLDGVTGPLTNCTTGFVLR